MSILELIIADYGQNTDSDYSYYLFTQNIENSEEYYSDYSKLTFTFLFKVRPRDATSRSQSHPGPSRGL